MKRISVLHVFLLAIFTSCKESAVYQKIEFEKIISLSRSHVKKIPSKLEKQMEVDFFKLSDRPIERTDTQKEVALKNTIREFFPLKAFLIDKSGNSLKGKSYLFEAYGGGEIDLSQYVKNSIGDFLFGFILEPKYNSDNTKIYYFSNIKGQACNKYKDITNQFFDKIQKKGLLTTNKNLIHLKLLVGTYVFISNIDEKFYLGQIHISDKRINDVLCR